MNWWAMVTAAYEIVKEAPHLVDDFKQLIDKIHSHEPAPDEVVAAMPDQLAWKP